MVENRKLIKCHTGSCCVKLEIIFFALLLVLASRSCSGAEFHRREAVCTNPFSAFLVILDHCKSFLVDALVVPVLFSGSLNSFPRVYGISLSAFHVSSSLAPAAIWLTDLNPARVINWDVGMWSSILTLSRNLAALFNITCMLFIVALCSSVSFSRTVL